MRCITADRPQSTRAQKMNSFSISSTIISKISAQKISAMPPTYLHFLHRLTIPKKKFQFSQQNIHFLHGSHL